MIWAWNHKLYILLAAAILYLGVARFTSDLAHSREIAVREKLFQETAQKLGAALGQQKSSEALAASLTGRNAALVSALQKAEKGAKVVERVTDTVTIHDTIPVTEQSPQKWEDPEGRFHLDLARGLLTREQRFRLDAVIILGPDGQTKVRGFTFEEISPKTGLVIPNEGLQIQTTFAFAREIPAVGVFHPRALAVLGSGGYGVGVEVANLHDRFHLSAVALYAPGTKSARIGPTVTWRVRLPFLDTNLGIGPSFLYDVRVGTWSPGAVATIELTR